MPCHFVLSAVIWLENCSLLIYLFVVFKNIIKLPWFKRQHCNLFCIFGGRIMSCWPELGYKVLIAYHHWFKALLIPNKDICQQNPLHVCKFNLQKASFLVRSFFLCTAEALCLCIRRQNSLYLQERIWLG